MVYMNGMNKNLDTVINRLGKLEKKLNILQNQMTENTDDKIQVSQNPFIVLCVNFSSNYNV